MPKRFNLVYTASDGSEKLATVVHRSSIGAIERVMAFIIEKYAGAFPLWLAPTQVKVIPVRENHNEKAEEVYKKLLEAGVRAEFDNSEENMGGKVREAKTNKIPYWIVLGDKDIEAGKVTLESRDAGQLGQMTMEEVLAKLQSEIKNKS